MYIILNDKIEFVQVEMWIYESKEIKKLVNDDGCRWKLQPYIIFDWVFSAI